VSILDLDCFQTARRWSHRLPRCVSGSWGRMAWGMQMVPTLPKVLLGRVSGTSCAAAPSPEVRSSRKSVRWVFAYAGPKICAVGSGMKPPGRPFLCPWNSIVRRQVGRGSKMPSKKGSSCSCTELLATAILGRGCAVGSRSGALIFACRRQCRMKHEIHAQRVCPPATSLHQFSVVVP